MGKQKPRLTKKQKAAAEERARIKALFITAHRQNGANIQNSCNVAGISRQTYYDWTDPDNPRFDPEFKASCDELHEECLDNVQSALYKSALEGDTRAQQFYLINKGRTRGWTNSSQVRVTGAVANPIIPNLSFEQAKELAKDLGMEVDHDPGLQA